MKMAVQTTAWHELAGQARHPAKTQAKLLTTLQGEVTGDVPFADSAPSSSTSTPKRSSTEASRRLFPLVRPRTRGLAQWRNLSSIPRPSRHPSLRRNRSTLACPGRLKIRPLNYQPHRNVALFSVQRIVRSQIIRKPVFPVHIFTIRLEQRERQLRNPPSVSLIGNPLPVSFHYFQILCIHPHHAFKIRLRTLHRFRLRLKNVAIHFVNQLPPNKFQLVFRQLSTRQRIRRDFIERVQIFRSEIHSLQCRLRFFDGLHRHSSIR